MPSCAKPTACPRTRRLYSVIHREIYAREVSGCRLFKKPEGAAQILLELNSKFSATLKSSIETDVGLCSRAELKARAIIETAEILKSTSHLSPSAKATLCIYDEVFADTICSVYFAGCALDKPAQMLLRRALELGFASVYLWDLPQRFWGWKDHDKDLNFNEMLEYFSTEAYKTFLKIENPLYDGADLVDFARARDLYRILSNVVHGKIANFESTLPDRFQHNPVDWKKHLQNVVEVEDILIDLWQARFEAVRKELYIKLPQLKMEAH